MRAETIGIRGDCPRPDKRTFMSRHAAKQALRRMIGEGKLDTSSRLRVYKCECGRFHFGHSHRAKPRVAARAVA